MIHRPLEQPRARPSPEVPSPPRPRLAESPRSNARSVRRSSRSGEDAHNTQAMNALCIERDTRLRSRLFPLIRKDVRLAPVTARATHLGMQSALAVLNESEAQRCPRLLAGALAHGPGTIRVVATFILWFPAARRVRRGVAGCLLTRSSQAISFVSRLCSRAQSPRQSTQCNNSLETGSPHTRERPRLRWGIYCAMAGGRRRGSTPRTWTPARYSPSARVALTVARLRRLQGTYSTEPTTCRCMRWQYRAALRCCSLHPAK